MASLAFVGSGPGAGLLTPAIPSTSKLVSRNGTSSSNSKFRSNNQNQNQSQNLVSKTRQSALTVNMVASTTRPKQEQRQRQNESQRKEQQEQTSNTNTTPQKPGSGFKSIYGDDGVALETLRATEFADQLAQVSLKRQALIKQGMDEEDEGLPLRYDPKEIADYWNARPLQVQKRLAEVVAVLTPFAAKVTYLKQRKMFEEKQREVACDLREVLIKLGPTFIKLGQGLSVRPDLVGPAFMEELRVLCDAVPPFDNELAFGIIKEELGEDAEVLFEFLERDPIGAASLGQVYKCRIRETGDLIALKVQRPDMLRNVSLDLFLLRKGAGLLSMIQDKFTANQTDYQGLLDTWARGTYKELDYINEGKNAAKFRELIKDLPDVVSPKVYFDYTGRKVLAMEFMKGVKFAEADPEEIKRLVNRGVECFLNQLLLYGVFHSDPHPSNVMATEDGKLCILDFGLMSEIRKPQMDAMIASIIHLANRDYPRVVDDFVELDFLPPTVDRAAVIPVLGAILDQALDGGGANSVNFQSLSSELSQVTFDFPFRIPPYFALIIRALGILEGIALTADPEFKLIMSAYPYISKRVLTDRSPALRETLTQILYKDGSFSPTRLQTLVESAQGFMGEGAAFVDFDTPPNRVSSRETLQFLFSDEGEFLREILSDEIANGIDVAARSVAKQLADNFNNQIPAPIRNLPFVLKAPVLPALSMEDEKYLKNMRDLLQFLVNNRTEGGKAGPEHKKKSRKHKTSSQANLFDNDLVLSILKTSPLYPGFEIARDVLVLSYQVPEMDLFSKLSRMNLQILGTLSERNVKRLFDVLINSSDSTRVGKISRRGRNIPY
eukprot:CAMPEP_0184691426 /NCGR_PEP_ID=MMETSP0313-20130426/288_1 /TAXON_ID=2792 /ORGANISM="Porphyridium aerugineum, Strain SAG 1380-2" /LENGTH=835 /DNA_ID=CAMNT_0027149143 /DNA_START=97 /DNA_END=2604 /DNA_ORIENTATION=+